MKKLLILHFIILSSFVANKIFAQTTDFSGKWLINKTKTNFGQAPEWALPRGFDINVANDQIMVERTTLDQQMAEHKSTETLANSGTEALSNLYNGLIRTASVKWTADKRSFIISASSVTDDGNPGAKITENWSLSYDGKTLIIDRTVVNPDGGTYSLKAYYDKQ